MIILSLETATEAASCAVIQDNKLLGEITFNYKKHHSVILMPMIDLLLKNLNIDIKSIDGFVVSKGPGSFTGLRIGAATVKGLCQGTGKPFIGVSTLDSLANNMAYTGGIICPIIDALRDNVYTALYSFNGDNLEIISDHMILNIEELILKLKEKGEPVCFIGDAVPKFREKLTQEFENVLFAPPGANLAKASSLGEIGIKLIKEGKCENIYSFAPIYLRKSQAEREYEKKMADKNE